METLTKQKQNQLQCLMPMLQAINAIIAITDLRIMSVEMEDGSGYNWNISVADYIGDAYTTATYYVGVDRKTLQARTPVITSSNLNHIVEKGITGG